MRVSAVIFLVMLYFVAMFRPMAPVIEYAVNYDYISKVLCINKDKPELKCNGKCHMKMMIEEQNKQDEELPVVPINMNDYPIGFVITSEVESVTNDLNIQLLGAHAFSILPGLDRGIFRPPTTV